MADINGIPYVEADDLVSGWPAVSQSVAQEVSDQLASKLPYSYGTATPSTTDSGFLWYDSNSTPAAPKFWDGAAFQALTSGKILQVVRATDSTDRTTTSTSAVDASLSVTITPTKSDSAIFLIAVVRFEVSRVGTDVIAGRGSIVITDSSNNAISGAENSIAGSDGLRSTNPINYLQQVAMAWSTPATTSSTTYKLRFFVSGAQTGTLANATQTAQLFAIEVAT